MTLLETINSNNFLILPSQYFGHIATKYDERGNTEDMRIIDVDTYEEVVKAIEDGQYKLHPQYILEEVGDIVDISSKSGYPSASLSNFTPHPFEIDGVKCTSMEGFLQSLKYNNPDMQVEICKLFGGHAKKKGAKKSKHWQRTQTLHWQGEDIPRNSERYQELLDKAFHELSKNDGFRRALLATNNANLTHSMGRNKINETVLTTREFVSRLTKIRAELKGDK